jgi:L-aminopeptidase/D-esterase-like protein
MKPISISSIKGVAIGNAERADAGTGLTVILTPHGAVTGLDVRGGAPASREAALLNPLAANDSVDAILLSGGSAFGLNAAAGVMRFLEDRGQGFRTSRGIVPIVCASCIYDLEVGAAAIRPDEKMAYQACMQAGNFRMGNYGAGCGASVGKVLGPEHMMKSGIGSYAVQSGDLQVGAIVVVNALGNVVDEKGRFLAGVLDDQKKPLNAEDFLLAAVSSRRENTTIGVILTNAEFNKTQLTKIAGMGQDGLARSIYPAHTMMDGDSLYAMSLGTVQADINLAGALAARVVSKAIAAAVKMAEPAYNLPSYRSLFMNK